MASWPGELVLVLALAACAGPTVTDDGMRSQASRSAASAVSELETIRVVVESQLDGRAWWAYTNVLVTDSETALESIESTLASRQPPSRSSAPARQEVVSALGDAVDLSRNVRIAVRRHDEPELRKLLSDLGPLSDELDTLNQRYA